MNTVNIKPSNKWAIHDFALLNQQQRITGTKLEALYKLIQTKGETMRTKDEQLKGVKCLQYSSGEYVAIIHTPTQKGKFFPCMIKTVHLAEL